MKFWVQRIQCLTYLKLWESITHNSRIKEIIIFFFLYNYKESTAVLCKNVSRANMKCLLCKYLLATENVKQNDRVQR